MTLTATCPSCLKSGRVPEQAAGKQVKCPNCGERFTVSAEHAAGAIDDLIGGWTHQERPSDVSVEESAVAVQASQNGNGKASAAVAVAAPPVPVPAPYAAPVPAPSAAPPSEQREPWYYGFLDKYAKTGAVLGIVITALLLLLVGAVCVTVAVDTYNVFHMATPWRVAVAAFMFVCAVVVVAGLVLVPILFAMALIRVTVDVGRNIRRVVASLER